MDENTASTSVVQSKVEPNHPIPGDGGDGRNVDLQAMAGRDRNPYFVYLTRLSSGSRPTMSESLERIARIASGGQFSAEGFPWHQLRYQHVQVIRTALVETISERTGKTLSPSSVNKSLSAIRGVLKEAWRLELIGAEEFARATDIEPVRGSVPLRGRALSAGEIAALFHVCMRDQTPAGPRDA